MLEKAHTKNELQHININDLPLLAETIVIAFRGVALYSFDTYGNFDEKKITKMIHIFIPTLIK
jgi:hypothetical protein